MRFLFFLPRFLACVLLDENIRQAMGEPVLELNKIHFSYNAIFAFYLSKARYF